MGWDQVSGGVDTTTRYIIDVVNSKEKKEDIWLSHITKAPIPIENSKNQ